jgi:hypothetical protein
MAQVDDDARRNHELRVLRGAPVRRFGRSVEDAHREAEFANKKRLVDRWRLRREKQRLAESFAITRTVPRW